MAKKLAFPIAFLVVVCLVAVGTYGLIDGRKD